jgi:hypothetical protein
LIPTASCCSCVAGGQRLSLLFGPPGVVVVAVTVSLSLLTTPPQH